MTLHEPTAAYAPARLVSRISAKNLSVPERVGVLLSPVEAAGQQVAFVEQLVDVTTRRLATMLADRAAHRGPL